MIDGSFKQIRVALSVIGGIALCIFSPALAAAKEYHVAITGSDTNQGTRTAPFRTIQHAADVAQPGDIVTVHKGVYRECVTPGRGGLSDSNRITFQAAPGEKAVITGAERISNWENVKGDVWKAVIPNKFFGSYNPYKDVIHGDWYSSDFPVHTGMVYVDGDWLAEAPTLDQVLNDTGETPEITNSYLLNIAYLSVGASANKGAKIPATSFSSKHGTQNAGCSEGGECIGYIRNGDWVRYSAFDFGANAHEIQIRGASVTKGGIVELHLDNPAGELLGVCTITNTGDWQSWESFSARIKPTSGIKPLCLVFKYSVKKAQLWFAQADENTTTIWAQFKGVNPNKHDVEVNVRKSVFSPDKTGVSFITLRGFTLRDAATNWAPPTAGQIGLITAYWCKGWIIENNDIAYSRCCGISLGKYSDEWDNRAESAEGYVGTINRALAAGWNKQTVGSHIVRNNHIAYCGQTGIVGSLGCSFSTITGNEIHDIHLDMPFGGAEMAGIKFHGGIDVIISDNNIYRCGSAAGIWLDWMGQGAQITGNLIHDNSDMNIFLEMQHGPILVANNLLLGKPACINGQGVAFAHNLDTAGIVSARGDSRTTEFQQPHSTVVAGMYPAKKGDGGDDRIYNNLFAARANVRDLDGTALPCYAGGNVYTKGVQAPKLDTGALIKPDSDSGVTLTEKPDGWYLTISEDPGWRSVAKHPLVTTDLLGKASVTNAPFDNRDGSPIRITTDYFGARRDLNSPFPGPFEAVTQGTRTIKVWPKAKNAN